MFRMNKNHRCRKNRILRIESLESRELLSATPNAAAGKVVVVTSLTDAASGTGGKVTLRQAINLAGNGGTVNFDSSLAGGVIKMNLSAIRLTQSVTIDGGSLGITLDGQGSHSLFVSTADGIAIKGLTLKNAYGDYASVLANTGTVKMEDCKVLNSSSQHYGGAIGNLGALTLVRCSFINCACDGDGGAIQSRGPLTITDSAFSSNRANSGAALCVTRESTAAVTGTTFTGNHSSSSGGAIWVSTSGNIILTNCLLTNNTADMNGSAIAVYASSATLKNTIVANNSSGKYGTIYAANGSKALTVYNSTIADNDGAGIYSCSQNVKVYNTILVRNTSNTVGTVNGQNNLSTKKVGTGTIKYDSSKPLFAEGGYTLAAGSQAVDAGSNNYVQGKTDYAGETRIVNGIVDIGAYEYQIIPEITDVSVAGWEGVYDGKEHTVTVTDPKASSDTITYSLDGVTYNLTAAPAYIIGGDKIYVKVSRAGYSDWYGSASVAVAKRTIVIEGTSVENKVYDGTKTAVVHLGTVTGLLKGDDLSFTASGEFPSREVGHYNVAVTYTHAGSDAVYYDFPTGTVCSASIKESETKGPDLAPITVTAIDKYTQKQIDILGAGISMSSIAQVTVTFENIGREPTKIGKFYNAVRVKNADTGVYVINADNTWYERYYSDGILDSGDQGAFTFLMPKLAAGNYVLEVQLDNRGAVAEGNEENNYQEFAFIVGEADLVPVTVTAVDKYSKEEIDILGGGMGTDNVAQVTVSFQNTGDLPTNTGKFYSAVRVKNLSTGVYVVNSDGTWYERYYSDGVLNPGEQGSITFLMPKLTAGSYLLEVDIDNRGMVSEKNNGNNKAQYLFTVGRVDLEPVGVYAVDKYSQKKINILGGGMTTNDTAQITIAFQNTGDSATNLGKFYNAVRVKNTDTGKYIINSDGTWYERFYSGGVLEGGGIGTISFLMPKLAAGNYMLEVDIDNRSVVHEKDDANNYAAYTFTVSKASKAELPAIFEDAEFIDGLAFEF